MKKNILYTIFLFTVLLWTDLFGAKILLNNSPVFYKEGFNKKWINVIPHDKSWLKVQPGWQSLRFVDLPIPNIPKYKWMDLTDYKPVEMTFVIPFESSVDYTQTSIIPGIYFPRISSNYEIYINNKKIHHAIHLSKDKKYIYRHRNIRKFSQYIKPEYIKKGKNILTIRIIDFPNSFDAGFRVNGEHYIDEFKLIKEKTSARMALMFICIYLFVGILHLFFYFFRPIEKYNLFYGLFSIDLFLYLLMGSSFIGLIVQNTIMAVRLEFITLFMITPLMGAFLNSILSGKVRLITYILLIVSVVFSIVIIVIPFQPSIDLMKLWLMGNVFSFFYFMAIILKSFKDTYKRKKQKKPTFSRRTIVKKVFANSIPGNLLISVLLVSAFAIFDIVDTMYFKIDLRVTSYGFLIFIIGVTLILANRFYSVHYSVEKLNVDLSKKVEDLDFALMQIRSSEKKYRLIVDDIDDVIITLNKDMVITSINKAIYKHYKINPGQLINKKFEDIIKDISVESPLSRQILTDAFEDFKRDEIDVHVKTELKSRFITEPIQMSINMERVQVEDNVDLRIVFSGDVKDSLMKYLDTEELSYVIGNYLTTAQDISQRLTRNLEKYIDNHKVHLIYIAMREIIINAIEHGNLNITFEEKSKAMEENRYIDFIAKRQQNDKYKNRVVYIDYSLNAERVCYKVTDSGDGFDYNEVLNKNFETLNNDMIEHGRGIKIATEVFDEVKYNDVGNSVELIKKIG